MFPEPFRQTCKSLARRTSVHAAAVLCSVVAIIPFSKSLAANSFTLSAWIRPAETVPDAPVVICTSDPDGRSDGFGIFLDNAGRLSSYAGSATNAFNMVTGVIPAAGVWQHVCMVYDEGISSLYLSGEKLGVATNLPQNVSLTGSLYVGDDGYTAFDGQISLMDFLPEALSDDEVALLRRETASELPQGGSPAPAEGKAGVAAAQKSGANKESSLARRLRNLGCVSSKQCQSQRPRLRVFTELRP